ncbi:hypothetical protein ACHAXS_000832 [Conticribra weissflogii]
MSLKFASNSWTPMPALEPGVVLSEMSRDLSGKEIFCACWSGRERLGV